VSEPVLLDSDTLSELSRGHSKVVAAARAYLTVHGRLTISAITVFERLRGYRSAIDGGKPYEEHERQFRALVATCRVLPVDLDVADHASGFWAQLGVRKRKALGDLLIAATASANDIPLVTRNRKDFAPMTKLLGSRLRLADWTR
jgi:tRNA(fMet)-specific endonuclease VapC